VVVVRPPGPGPEVFAGRAISVSAETLIARRRPVRAALVAEGE
jgi:hypothetical protein